MKALGGRGIWSTESFRPPLRFFAGGTPAPDEVDAEASACAAISSPGMRSVGETSMSELESRGEREREGSVGYEIGVTFGAKV